MKPNASLESLAEKFGFWFHEREFALIKFIGKKDEGAENRLLEAVEKWINILSFEIQCIFRSKSNITRALKEVETEIGDHFYE